jgi:glycosyltransferase involved in cell wall biosynthesis
LKLLITSPYGERLGGAENMLGTFLRHLDKERIQPIVVFFEPGPFEREVAGLGIRTAIVPTGRLRQLRKLFVAVRTLAALIRSERPDLVLNWMPKAHLYGATAAILSGMADRLVWWQHGIPERHWLDRLATLLPARAVGCSSRKSADAQSRLWPSRTSFVVYPGIEEPRLPTPGMMDALRDELGLLPGKPVIGIVGRLQPWKGQDRLIRALAELRRDGVDACVLVVGGTAYDLSPEYEPYLRELVRELGLDGSVFFTGQVADPAPFLELMDVLVNASEAEPFGIVLIEAMSLEVPVVAVDAGGPAEIVVADQSGVLVPNSDPRVLAHAVQRLLSDDRLRRDLAKRGRRRFEALFTAERMSSEIDKILIRLARSD